MKPYCRTCRVSAICLACPAIFSRDGMGTYRLVFICMAAKLGGDSPAHLVNRACTARMPCLQEGRSETVLSLLSR